MKTPDLRLSLGLSLIALGTLAAEILMIRVFEVILLPHIGYAVITCAMFGFGAAGAVATLWPVPEGKDVRRRLALLAVLFAVSLVVLRPALNAAPQLYHQFLSVKILEYLLAGSSLYLLTLAPFFFSGLLLAYLFSAYPSRIRSLYFWDLTGAALGCVIYLPFDRAIGPGGLMFCIAGVILLASALFAGTRRWSLAAVVAALGLFAFPVLRTHGYYEFNGIEDKREVLDAIALGKVEYSEWDPVSKIDVVDNPPWTKRLQYDGGSQTSDLFRFDGDLGRLRRDLLEGRDSVQHHFWYPTVMAAHYLKRDSDARVLIIGSAGGQETKAALMFNPASVDGIELVGAVVRLGKENYADFVGRIFADPRVNNQQGEGRSWLRASGKQFDIIQIFSNHTTSLVLSGIGASMPTYLQTVEAYKEYFSHLSGNGVLQINHHYYPRMVTTAARAWKEMGRTDFQRHVLIYEYQGGIDLLPTMLIKMSPWTAAEVQQIEDLLASVKDGHAPPRRVIDPLAPGKSFLSAAFFTGELPAALQDELVYQAYPLTDDRPYFNNIQKGFTQRHDVVEDSARFMNRSMAFAINHPFSFVNRDVDFKLGENLMPVAIGGIGALFGLLLILVPLRFSSAGRLHWPSKYLSLGYFALLGAGFIMVELVLIQLFIELLGVPLYAYTTVIFAMLMSAGLGSMAAKRLDISPTRRWSVPFAGVLVMGTLLLLVHPSLFNLFLAAPTAGRIAAAIAMIFPLGFFMGMPFPLGILWLERHPRGAIAWAWGVNGLFTVIGGVGAGVLAIHFGFRLTFVAALGIYLLACIVLATMRSRELAGTRPVGPNVLPISPEPPEVRPAA